jgi:hypothetical protein
VRVRRAAAALAPALAWCLAGCLAVGLAAGLPTSRATFVAGTSAGASWGAAASFPSYAQAVVADGPSFYYRMDDAAGSTTATDASGNGSTGVHAPYTGANLATGLWPLDDAAGPTARDLSGASPAADLSLQGTAAWTASGHAGSALELDGAAGYAVAAPAVGTTARFSVGAWVRLTSTAADAVAVSQAGTTVSGFTLGYEKAADRWSFRMPRTDDVAATVDAARSTAAPALNTWTHLAGVFTGTQVLLYVDGALQATTSHPATFPATGALEAGAALSTTRTAFWPGRVDDVRTWSTRALPAGDVAELARGVTSGPHTVWPFEEGAGATAYDAAGGLVAGTLGAGAAWTTSARTGARALAFTGTDPATGHVAGAGPAVDTAAAFSVAAWVYLAATGADATAVSQAGDHDSGFVLGFDQASGRWAFTLPAADSGTASRDVAASAGAAAAGTWTHLAGVFDPGTGTATLYVDGASAGTVAHAATWTAAGALQAARDLRGDAWAAPWNGRLDDVRLFRRAISAAEVAALRAGTWAAATALGAPGALRSDAGDHAVRLAGRRIAAKASGFNPVRRSDPTTFTLECWFRTTGYDPATSTAGVTLVDFGSTPAGNSPASDRRLYVDAAGHVVFGTAAGTSGAASTASAGYLDGDWHHVAATSDPGGGLRLYVDGSLAGTAPYTAPAAMSGYWRFGGNTWFTAWPADYFSGDLDEVAVYPTALTAQQVAWHYHADH